MPDHDIKLKRGTSGYETQHSQRRTSTAPITGESEAIRIHKSECIGGMYDNIALGDTPP